LHVSDPAKEVRVAPVQIIQKPLMHGEAIKQASVLFLKHFDPILKTAKFLFCGDDDGGRHQCKPGQKKQPSAGCREWGWGGVRHQHLYRQSRQSP
jgi:hypothetical protein